MQWSPESTGGSIHAQAPGRGAPALPPSVSKRGNRQIGSSASNFLGVRVGFSADAFGPISFSEAAAKADALGTGFLEASSSQKVSAEIPKNLDYNSVAGRSSESQEQAGRASPPVSSLPRRRDSRRRKLPPAAVCVRKGRGYRNDRDVRRACGLARASTGLRVNSESMWPSKVRIRRRS